MKGSVFRRSMALRQKRHPDGSKAEYIVKVMFPETRDGTLPETPLPFVLALAIQDCHQLQE